VCVLLTRWLRLLATGSHIHKEPFYNPLLARCKAAVVCALLPMLLLHLVRRPGRQEEPSCYTCAALKVTLSFSGAFAAAPRVEIRVGRREMMANGAAIQIKFESLFYFQARNINLSFYLPSQPAASRIPGVGGWR
jgi:hypothetical protein